MVGIPLIRASAVRSTASALASLGAPVDAILSSVSLPPASELDPDTLISYQQVLDFFEAGRRRTGLGNLPLLAARHADVADLGSWGRWIGQATTLGGMLGLVVRTYPLHTTGATWWLAERGSEILLCQRYDRRLDLGAGHAIFVLLSFMVGAVRTAVGPDWRPRRITLGAPLSLSLEALGIDAAAPVTGVTSIAVPRDLWSAPMPRRAEATDGKTKAPLKTLQDAPPTRSFQGSLRQALGPLLSRNDLEIEDVAEITRLSVRTLQRRLARSGQSFRGLLQELRFARAIERMQDPTVKLIDVAFDLGFSDPAHFTRAFRRWTGVSPREFRRVLRAEGRTGDGAGLGAGMRR